MDPHPQTATAEIAPARDHSTEAPCDDEALIQAEIEQLKAESADHEKATLEALSEADSLRAVIDELRAATVAATEEVGQLRAQLHDAKLGRHSAQLFVVGGMGSRTDRYRSVECFDGTEWRIQQAQLNFIRSASAVAVYKHGLYAVGGFNGDHDADTVDRFDGETWVTIPPMPCRRSTCGAVTFNDALYVIGGCNGNSQRETRYQSVDKWDGREWTPAPPMSTERSGVCCVLFNDCIYAIGGRNNTGGLSSVEKFDGSEWSAAPTMSKQRVQACAAVFQGKLYVYGGSLSQSIASQIVEVFDGTEWATLEIPRKFYDPISRGAAMAVYNNSLYIIGGVRGQDYSTDVVKYDGTTWSRAPSLTRPRSVAAAIAF